jgi:hypothetical protein
MFLQNISCVILPLCYFIPMKHCIAWHQAAPAPADGAPVPVPSGRSGRARTGKIARLPHAVRQALNERLRDGLSCDDILAWINSLPVARESLQKHGDGAPITQDNLSWWRHGGYAGWLEHQQATEALAIMAEAGRGIGQEQREALTGQLALAVAARMVEELRKFNEMPEGPAKSAAWKNLVWSLTLLRRSEFYAGKLQLERDKLAAVKAAQKVPETGEERAKQIEQILGMGEPHWNNFTHQWEGEGAAEMTEKEEVRRMVVAEMLRRKEERKAKEEGRIMKEETGQTTEPAGTDVAMAGVAVARPVEPPLPSAPKPVPLPPPPPPPAPKPVPLAPPPPPTTFKLPRFPRPPIPVATKIIPWSERSPSPAPKPAPVAQPPPADQTSQRPV